MNELKEKISNLITEIKNETIKSIYMLENNYIFESINILIDLNNSIKKTIDNL